jgi:hypothetical protein
MQGHPISVQVHVGCPYWHDKISAGLSAVVPADLSFVRHPGIGAVALYK